MKKLLCFDYDMTLLDHATGQIPASTQEAVRLLRPTWKIVLATGRDMEQPESTYGMETVQPDAVVQMNGAKVCAEGKVLYEYFLPQELMQRIFAFALQKDLCVSCLLDNVYYTTKPQPLRDFVYTCVRQTPITVRPAQEAFGRQVRALALVGNTADARLLEAAFPEIKVPLFAQKRGADIIPRALSKAEGMRRVLAYYGSDFSQVVFFGDSGNDLELIAEAKLGIAMGNAIPQLKEAADYVTDAVGKNGIWNALVHFHFLQGEKR
ncbi:MULTISPECIES: HAD-IIB family hydrolase [Caproicibacterium]|uniref:HAD-IIB family hydrolase n=1 Tax=Caproicibacterium argilliputei TaxID=3030016 RepID=A0AA97H0J6_9FIRM|nr:HAD-IIB family hydrolase [Caproicibacterium argilliputei]WOC31606.1 HAD-IIB family hydrolase [Caproicibacterium argilliputei]